MNISSCGRVVCVSIATALIVLSGVAAIAEQCGPFTFGSDSDWKRHIKRALARVHAPDASSPQDRHEGAATVIHLNPMLLVTASHVVPKDTAKISFPNLGDNRLYSITVIARSGRRLSVAGKSAATSSSQILDFAVLGVDDPPLPGVDALEVWFDQVNEDASHHLAAYGRDLSEPLWGGGSLVRKDECAWRLRETAFNGDSGGAVVSENGLLVGIVLDGREGGQFDDGAMGQVTILPLGCVRQEILSAFDQKAPVSGGNVLDVEKQSLQRALQPPPSSGWIDNLSYARALRDLVADRDLLHKIKARNAIGCPLFRSTIERELGYDTAEQLISSTAESTKEAADIFNDIGDQYKTANAELAQRLYASAVSSYEAYIRTSLGIPSTAGLPPLTSAPLDVAQATVGRAVALSNLADVSVNSGIDSAMTRIAAISAAAYAARAAPNEPIRGFAYALIGNSAFQARQYQTAIQAYSSAVNNGYNTRWIKSDYLEAFRLRDNVVEPHVATDYRSLGSYPGLSEARIEELIR